jgi:hypothetical protein
MLAELPFWWLWYQLMSSLNYFSTTAKQVFFFHDQQLIAVNLDGLAAVLAEQRGYAPFTPTEHFACVFLPGLQPGFRPDLAFSSAVWNDDARGGFGFVFHAFDNHAVVHRTKFHKSSFKILVLSCWRVHQHKQR